jgi:hypothetical protein
MTSRASSGRNATTLVMVAIFGGACLIALGLPSKAAFMPLLVGIPGLLLSLAQLAVDNLGHGTGTEGTETEMAAAAANRRRGRSEAQMFGWLTAFTLGLLGFGFLLGGPVLVVLFVRFATRSSWPNAFFAGAGTLAVLYGSFNLLLGLPLFEGLLAGWLGL